MKSKIENNSVDVFYSNRKRIGDFWSYVLWPYNYCSTIENSPLPNVFFPFKFQTIQYKVLREKNRLKSHYIIK